MPKIICKGGCIGKNITYKSDLGGLQNFQLKADQLMKQKGVTTRNQCYNQLLHAKKQQNIFTFYRCLHSSSQNSCNLLLFCCTKEGEFISCVFFSLKDLFQYLSRYLTYITNEINYSCIHFEKALMHQKAKKQDTAQ